MEKSRTKNTIKNVKTGLIVQVINKLMAFVVRTVFIKILNSEYLGVNGLFTNVLTMLSFAELGIGTAIIFNMYKPVADNDKEKIKSLMKLYKKSYNIIGIIILLLGVVVIPFMSFFISDIPNIKENIICIYLLFLVNTSISYFFTYKKSIIFAYQQESIINKIDSFFYLIKSIFEIVFLMLTKNYIVYLLIQIISTFTENFVIAKKAEKMFPFLKEKNINKLSRDETKSIFSNVKALITYKLGEAILSGTDNILISALVNVSTVGLCSNYTLIIESIRRVIVSSFNGVTASVGNLNAMDDTLKKEKIFHQLTLISFWIYGLCFIAFIVLLNPFISFWLGNNFVLDISVSISLALNFFVCGLRSSAFTYRTTMGLFEKGKITPFIASIINIVYTIILGKKMGVTGIFLATSIAQIFSYSWIDPYLIYKYEFKKSMKNYLVKILKYSLILFLSTAITCLCSNMFIKCNDSMLFFIKILLVGIIPNITFILFLKNTDEFVELKNRFFKSIINKIGVKNEV